MNLSKENNLKKQELAISPWMRNRINTMVLAILDILLFSTINLSFHIIIEKDYKNIIFGNSDFLFCSLLFIFSSYLSGRYSISLSSIKSEKNKEKPKKITTNLINLALFFIPLSVYNYTDKGSSLDLTLLFIPISLTILISNQIVNIKSYIGKGSESFNKKWIHIGTEDVYRQLKSDLKLNKRKYEIISMNFFSDKEIDISNFSGLIIDENYTLTSKENKIIDNFFKSGVKIISLYDWCEYSMERIPPNLIKNNVNYFSNPYDKFIVGIQLRIKRLIDIIFSILLLIITSPIILIAFLLIYIEDRKYILYKQKRNGYLFRPITLWKLRTMKKDAEISGAQWSKANDPRITKVGAILRKLRIDELPQLIQVIKGDMSLIGPRPERIEFDNDLQEMIPYYNSRYSIRPGLSGWAQVNYPYGASVKDSEMKLSYDLYYINNFSLALDILILFKTIRMILNAKGAIPNN